LLAVKRAEMFFDVLLILLDRYNRYLINVLIAI